MSFETYSTGTQEIIEVEEVNHAYKISAFADPNGVSIGDTKEEPKMVDRLDKKIRTIIYTDGNITKVEESEPIAIDEYYINGTKYNSEVNQLIKKKLYIEKATYIVNVVVADEILKYGSNGKGHFDVIKDINILLKDKKDKEAKKKVKDTVKIISKDSKNHKSLWDVFFGIKVNPNDSLVYEKVADNVYRLKQMKQTR